MDHTKLAMLLLIVSGTIVTLGSPITENETEDSKDYPALSSDTKELKDLVLISSDQYDNNKRVAAATVIAGAELDVTVLQRVLGAYGAGISRMIAIGIDNESGYKWKAMNVYFWSGTSDAVMAKYVASGRAVLYDARKTRGPFARGAVGVMTYYIPGIDKTLAVMYSVPFDYNLYSNWWDVKLYSGKKWASQEIFEDMYYGNPWPFEGDNSWHTRKLGSGLKYKGAMSSSGSATLEIHVNKY